MLIFFIDVDNKERYKIMNADKRLKSFAVEFKRSSDKISSENKFYFDIKKLGVLEIENIILDVKQRAAILKCSLICDYRILNEEEKQMLNVL
jgi:hypothetical protein